MARAPTPARVSAPALDLDHNKPPCQQAEAIREQTAEMAQWREAIFGEEGAYKTAIEPALKVFAGFGERLDKLCQFLKSPKPWMALAGFLLLSRTVNAAPGEVPQLLQAAAELVKAFQ